MAWEPRGNGRYFYLSVRRDGRVTKQYFGRGQVAALTAIHIKNVREERATDQLQWRRTQDRLVGLDRAVDTLNELSRLLLIHYRIERNWRGCTKSANGVPPLKSNSPDACNADDLKHLRDLLQRASEGDTEASSAARTLLDESPDLWCKLGDLSQHAVSTWVGLISGADDLLKEATQQKVRSLANSLVLDETNPLEQLLVQRVVATWLQVHHADSLVSKMKEGTRTQLLKRQQAAQRQHLAAIRGLSALQRKQHSGDAVAFNGKRSRL